MAPYDTVDAEQTRAGSTSAVSLPSNAPARSRWWVWLVVIGLVAAGLWYVRARGSQSASSAAVGGVPGPGGPGAAPGNFVVPVVVATATKGDLPVFYNGLGTVTALNTVTVRTRIDGELINVVFKEGQFVKQGDLLAEIDSRPYKVQLEQAQGQLAKDVAARKDAEVNLERYKLLFKEGVIPQQQLDTQGASVGQFDGAIQTDQANIDNAKLNIAYCRITAPISGRVGLRLVDSGNMVHASDSNGLLVITEVQPIAVVFSLPQDQLPAVYSRLRNGQELSVEAYDRDNTSKIATGKLLTIDNQIDPTTGTYKLKSIFSNADNSLFPNQFVNVHLLVDTKKNVVMVPTAAILRGAQGIYVFLVGADNTVKVRNITVAETNGNVTGVSKGLAAGEMVVTDGQDKLQDGSKVEPRTAPSGAASSGAAATASNSSFASAGGGPAR
ncbi:MAG TPA: MdtA/MuxA family multidrug efflux RND transporter periplasmic adaptor subunit [Candidatus Acidoferrum sp.]